MGVEFKKMDKVEAEALRRALDRNASEGKPLKMDPLHTGWVPDDGLETDDDVVSAIQSVPCHYADAVLQEDGTVLVRFSDGMTLYFDSWEAADSFCQDLSATVDSVQPSE